MTITWTTTKEQRVLVRGGKIDQVYVQVRNFISITPEQIPANMSQQHNEEVSS